MNRLGVVVCLLCCVCMTRPLTMLAAVLPFLETIVGVGGFLVALTLSVPITLLTIATAWIVHRPLIGLGFLLAAILSMLALRYLAPRRTIRAMG